MATDKTPMQGAQVLLKTKTRSAKRRDSNSDSPKTWRACNIRLSKRLRRLIVADKKRSRLRDHETNISRRKMALSTWAFLIIILCAGLCLHFNDNSLTVNEFLLNYKNQYYSIVNNRDNYCDRFQRLSDMVVHVRRQVLNQDQALSDLERALDSPTHQIIALVGSSGVGKSQTAHILHDRFPWPENVKTLSWSGTRSLRRVQGMLSHLVHCGQNMILIDNMIPEDVEHVPVINEMIKERKDIANNTEQPHLKRLTVVLIFSVSRMQANATYEEEIQSVQKLPNTHVISFATLEPIHLIDCIRREARINKVVLDDGDIEEIRRGSDVHTFGCKAVPAKVLLYGKPMISEDRKGNVGHSID
ncbi:uncharacterized protein LOC108103488 [Drosophila eugracilis]|uniref:uncharacterized protein LOC108103488 n=1 Tax=Drosophila eugracilis TaxID=29029 RepID=UPI0007E6B9E5|nr:uncharacterized protein LOC108103488 [Drosophila eugracilis]